MRYNADGTIQQVSHTTDDVPQIGHLDPYVRVEGETFNAQSGIETEPCKAGGMNVRDIQNGDWIRIKGVDFGLGGARELLCQRCQRDPGRQNRASCGRL